MTSRFLQQAHTHTHSRSLSRMLKVEFLLTPVSWLLGPDPGPKDPPEGPAPAGTGRAPEGCAQHERTPAGHPSLLPEPEDAGRNVSSPSAAINTLTKQCRSRSRNLQCRHPTCRWLQRGFLNDVRQLHQGVCPRRLWPHQTQHVRAAEDGHGHPGAGCRGDDPVGSSLQLERVSGMLLNCLSVLSVCLSVSRWTWTGLHPSLSERHRHRFRRRMFFFFPFHCSGELLR